MLTDSRLRKGFFEAQDAQEAFGLSEAGFGFSDGKAILFHPLEAAYLAKTGKAQVAPKALAALKKKGTGFAFALAAYGAIRSTGRLVRPFVRKTTYFRAYAPGVGRTEGRPCQLVCLIPGAEPSTKSISGHVKVAHLLRMDLVIACGTGKEVQFYKVSSMNFG